MEGMALQQYAQLLKKIKDEHSFGNIEGGKHIKYVDSCFDMRTLSVWSVSFRGLVETKSFATTDDPKSEENLYDVVLKWLNFKTNKDENS